MSSSRIFRVTEGDAPAVAWEAPEVVPARDDPPPLDPEQVRLEAHREGFEQGQTEGFAAGQARVTAHAQALERVLGLFTRPMANLDHRVEEEIVALIKQIVQRLLRREMELDSTHIKGIVRDGLNALPVAQGDIVLRLHADDAAIVEQYLGAEQAEGRWRIEIDPTVGRGGCLVFAADSQIDARVETRLARVIATMFEDQRKPTDDAGDAND